MNEKSMSFSVEPSICIFKRLYAGNHFIIDLFIIWSIDEWRLNDCMWGYTLAQLVCWIRTNECSNGVESDKDDKYLAVSSETLGILEIVPRATKIFKKKRNERGRRRRNELKNSSGIERVDAELKCISLWNDWNNFYVARFC